jgi:hypothetical protein
MAEQTPLANALTAVEFSYAVSDAGLISLMSRRYPSGALGVASCSAFAPEPDNPWDGRRVERPGGGERDPGDAEGWPPKWSVYPTGDGASRRYRAVKEWRELRRPGVARAWGEADLRDHVGSSGRSPRASELVMADVAKRQPERQRRGGRHDHHEQERRLHAQHAAARLERGRSCLVCFCERSSRGAAGSAIASEKTGWISCQKWLVSLPHAPTRNTIADAGLGKVAPVVRHQLDHQPMLGCEVAGAEEVPVGQVDRDVEVDVAVLLCTHRLMVQPLAGSHSAPSAAAGPTRRRARSARRLLNRQIPCVRAAVVPGRTGGRACPARRVRLTGDEGDLADASLSQPVAPEPVGDQ